MSYTGSALVLLSLEDHREVPGVYPEEGLLGELPQGLVVAFLVVPEILYEGSEGLVLADQVAPQEFVGPFHGVLLELHVLLEALEEVPLVLLEDVYALEDLDGGVADVYVLPGVQVYHVEEVANRGACELLGALLVEPHEPALDLHLLPEKLDDLLPLLFLHPVGDGQS